MTHQITQLTMDDYDELLLFTSRAFIGIEDANYFLNLIPSIYKPIYNKIGDFYAIKIEGKIRALLRINRHEQVVGNKILSVAILGEVSTDPDFREQGLMQAIMKFAVEKMANDKIDLAYLNGNRQRYKYFGFESCGTKSSFIITKSNLKKLNLKAENLVFEVVKSLDLATSRELNQMFKKLNFHTIRTDEAFFDISTAFHKRLTLVKKGDTLVGYFIGDGKQFSEFAAISDEMRLAILNESPHEETEICLTPADRNLLETISCLDSKQDIYGTGFWQIFNHEKVLITLMELKNSYSKLAYGEALFNIQNTGTYKLQVSKDGISCQKVKEDTTNSFTQEQFMRIALGPLAPYLITDLPEDLEIFNNWFPLPIYCMDKS